MMSVRDDDDIDDRDDYHDDWQELQLEDDGTFLIENLKNVFAQASTLKYRHPETKCWRIIKCIEGVLHPPEDDGWGDPDLLFVAVIPKGMEIYKGESKANNDRT